MEQVVPPFFANPPLFHVTFIRAGEKKNRHTDSHVRHFVILVKDKSPTCCRTIVAFLVRADADNIADAITINGGMSSRILVVWMSIMSACQ